MAPGITRGFRIRGQRSEKVKETQSPVSHSTSWPPESLLNLASLGSPSLERIYPRAEPQRAPIAVVVRGRGNDVRLDLASILVPWLLAGSPWATTLSSPTLGSLEDSVL